MTRRSPRRSAFIAWTESLRDVFTPFDGLGSPPAQVRVWRSLDGERVTLQARFVSAEGRKFTATTRLRFETAIASQEQV